MFGRDYEEIGSAEKGLILKNSGKVKIQWGKKFIDLLDSNGNLNAKVQSLIKKVSSENEIKDDGFYYLDDSLIAKIGDNVLELTSESGTTFVSFMVEQETTDEQKYTALKNIGFVYREQSNTNVYPKNGIIYIEESQTLFIVNNGTLSKYIAPIQNPYTQQFVIQKGMEDTSDGALVIEGEGSNNSLKFDTLKIYVKEEIPIFESTKEFQFFAGNKKLLVINLQGIETNSVRSPGANNIKGYRIWEEDGKYVLDIDKINVREGIKFEDNDYYDPEIYSKRFIINYFDIINSSNTIYGIFNTNINDNQIINNSLIHIPIKVISCQVQSQNSINYLNPLQRISYVEIDENNEQTTINESLEEIHIFKFKYYDNKLYFINDKNEVIYPEFKKYPFLTYDGTIYDSIKITEDNTIHYYVFECPDLDKAFISRSLYVVSEPNTNQRLKFDFDNPSITLQQNDRRNTRLSEYDQIKHVKIGDVHNQKTYSDDENENGLFSDLNVFVGGEFRQPIPTQKKVNGYLQDVPQDIYYYHFPRYSEDLTKGMTLQIFNHDEIILPKKWIPQAANYIEDLTAYSGTLESRDDNLYDGKLFLYKVTGTSSNNITASFHLSPQYDKNGNIINTRYFGPYTFYDRGTAVKENDYKQNTILLAQYKNGQINVLRNPGLITIKSEGSAIATEPKFDTINFKGSTYVDFTVSKSNKTINVKVNITQALENRLTAIENNISNIKSDITTIKSDIRDIKDDITDIKNRLSNVEDRLTNVENGSGNEGE